MIFYPGDKVKINLDTSSLHGHEGVVITATYGKVKVKVDDTEYWYWDDEVILMKRNKEGSA